MNKVKFKGYYFKKGLFWICWYYGTVSEGTSFYADNTTYLTSEPSSKVYAATIKLTEKGAIKWISKTGTKLLYEEKKRQTEELYSQITKEMEHIDE